MNQISTRYVTEGEACYEQYVLSDPAAKTELVITPERGGMITGFTLDEDEYIWVRRPNFSECNRPRFAVPFCSPAAPTRTAASISLTASPTPWRPTPGRPVPLGGGQRRARRRHPDACSPPR